MVIYLVDKEKKGEVLKFRKYWEEKLFPTIKSGLYDFCSEVNGQIVNTELAESILEGYRGHFLEYSPVGSTMYRESILTINHAGAFWHNYVLDGVTISSISELTRFFEKGANKQKYGLEDEEGKEYSLSELSDKIMGGDN